MICKDCRDAADVDRQELHCEIYGCTCQHQTISAKQPPASVPGAAESGTD